MKKLSEIEKKASSKVLGELRKHTQQMMNDKMKGLKKVTVASDSAEGLKKGLSKAEELIKGKMPKEDDLLTPEEGELDKAHGLEEESEEEEASESPEMEASEDESMEEHEYDEEECKTPEEIDAKIKELLKKKAEMLKK